MEVDDDEMLELMDACEGTHDGQGHQRPTEVPEDTSMEEVPEQTHNQDKQSLQPGSTTKGEERFSHPEEKENVGEMAGEEGGGKEELEDEKPEVAEGETELTVTQRVCHTHERAIPMQDTVEALDITEEGESQSVAKGFLLVFWYTFRSKLGVIYYMYFFKHKFCQSFDFASLFEFKSCKPEVDPVYFFQVWRRCCATWSCTPSAGWSCFTPPSPTAACSATEAHNSYANSPKCTEFHQFVFVCLFDYPAVCQERHCTKMK